MSTEHTIRELIERSRAAQKIAEGFSQRKVDELAAAIVYTFSRPELAREIAEECVAETDIGNVESKKAKLMNKMPAIFYQVKDVKTVGVIDRDPEMGITKIAKPIGVIAALVPSTNPEATPIFKGVLGLRARNAVIFAPHPASKKTSMKVVDIMREILEKNGAPKDLFICIDQPSKDLSQELMRQADLTMATGSGDMVKAAYSSGKPAYGVGAGNAVVVIDETADLAETAAKIRIGKTGDNASGCSAENSLVIHESVYDEMLELLQLQGGYLASPEEKARLQEVMWEDGHLSRDIVAKPVDRIANLAGINIPDNTAFLMVKETGVGKDYPFSGEKMSLVLTVYKYSEFDEAIDMVNRITSYSGFGHSCGIHSNNQEHIMQLALNTKTTKVIVRQPHGAANSGAWFNGLANTFSLGCGTWGGNIVSENVTQKHYMNTTWVAEPIDRQPASEEEIFGDLLATVNV
ncbi:aldehyde dehydrogenase family protein [Bacillus oleivorans]|uniref:aldehyde dehydrogenase family protein n=1 Tax=Bacillus oleivorans TaxID=1448271 RepID=UPI001C546206|nr:aldehyde dehydrogenase family protein [Bacillus oleivorans]